MRTTSGEAILLEVTDLHERDRIVAFLTRDRGPKRGVARAARRRYSRFAGQLQPLAKVHITWFEKDDRELVRVRSVELIRPASRLYEQLESILVGYYLAENVSVFAPENVESELVYRLLDSTVDAMVGGVDLDLAARYFESWILRLAGIFPAPRECPACGGSLAATGARLPTGGESLLCRDCAVVGTDVEPATVELLLRLGREKLVGVASDPPPRRELRRVEELCAAVRRRFLDGELKSYTVMERTLSELSGGGAVGGDHR